MQELSANVITTLIIIFATIVTLSLVQLLSRRLHRRIESMEGIRKERRQQTITFLQIIVWSASVVIIAAALLMVLSTFGVDITPLLASVGIAGLALSLGAQTLIKDFIGGFLILLENQFVVGDTIELDALTGKVERITLRVTYLRDIRGLQYIVPNGEIRILANQNKEWVRVLVDVNVAYDEDLTRVRQVMGEAVKSFAAEMDYSQDFLEEPMVVGPVMAGDWALTMRVTVKVKPDHQVQLKRDLHVYILQALKKEGISPPFPSPGSWVLGAQ